AFRRRLRPRARAVPAGPAPGERHVRGPARRNRHHRCACAGTTRAVAAGADMTVDQAAIPGVSRSDWRSGPDLSGIRAVILAGGLGTRLRPYTTIIPKPLVPVGERPIVQHIMEQLYLAGVTQIGLCVNYLGGLIQAYLEQARLPEGLRLNWHWEDEPSGTAGALRSVPD